MANKTEYWKTMYDEQGNLYKAYKIRDWRGTTINAFLKDSSGNIVLQTDDWAFQGFDWADVRRMWREKMADFESERGNLMNQDEWESFESEQEEKDDLDADKEELRAEIEEQTGEYKTAVERAGEEQEEYAERLSARKGGQMARTVSEAILGTGGEAPAAEFATERLSEASGRQLSDIVQGIGAGTKSKLAEIEGMDVGNVFTMEQLGQRQEEITNAMTRFFQQQETERAGIQAQLDVQPEWWEGIIGDTIGAAGTFYGAKAGATIASGGTMAWTCFDGSVGVVGIDSIIPFELLKEGDVISTTSGFKPVSKVHKYNASSTINVDGIKVTGYHPYIMEDGSLELSGKLKEGDVLWGGEEVKSIVSEEGSDYVYNIDIDGHNYHIENGALVHTGRRRE